MFSVDVCVQVSDGWIWGHSRARGSYDTRISAELRSVQELVREVKLHDIMSCRCSTCVRVNVKDCGIVSLRFPSSTEHLVMNEQNCTTHNVRSHKLQTQLNLIHPDVFPQLRLYKSKVLKLFHFWQWLIFIRQIFLEKKRFVTWICVYVCVL